MAKYKAYPEYKDSGIEWIGKIPSHWEVASLSKLFSIKAGGDVQQSIFSEVCSDEHPYPIYTNANDEFAVYGYTKKANYQSNTITVSGRGEVGFAVYRNHAYDAIIRLLVLTPLKQLECKFYSYFINSVIDFKVESSAIGQLSTQQISPYKSVVPSRVEQRSITAFLDHETSKIDNLIEKQQQLIELLKEKRQAVISNAVNIRSNERKTKLKNLVNIQTGYPFPSAKFKFSPDNSIPLLRGVNVGVDSIKWDDVVYWDVCTLERLNEYLLVAGDIVFGMDRPWISSGARVSEIKEQDLPCLLLQRVARIRSNIKSYQPFIKLCLSSNEFREYAEMDLTGVSVPHISPEQISNFYVRDIPFDDQFYLTKNALEKIGKIELNQEMAEQAIQLLQERRTALISAAVTGKIDVRDWVAPATQEAEEPQEATA
ncbi:restriction endonuclease subunit S [Yokenella regensburgei]|uniref:restriction endonuclease subunit S n=1 Tax=Yokenella regensburgei TaxID=158877 RepID=UPI00289DB2EF|nr:restriction endonuclease subunit S [Yokenella regensburgei]